MIRLYAENETNFDNNGLAVLDADIKENTVEEKMNGIYEFDFAYLSSGKYANLLDGDMIVKAPTPDGNQLFRIIKVTKNIGYLEVNCYHIFYDLAGNFIEDINIVGQNGQDALDHMDTGMQYPTRFKFMSNMTQARNARMVRLNAVQALLDASQDNSFLSRWGGEIKRDNFTVLFNDVRGNDKGFKVQHGKNLTGYEAEIDYSTVVTKIMPYGYDGLMLPEKYVDSPLKDKYAFTRIKKIEYKDIKAIDPEATTTDEDAVPLEQAYVQLRAAASREYSVNKIDIPTSNFKITFKNLADTKEYADFKALEKVLPWDYVTVVTPDFNITSRMISYQYDALTKQYKKIELGNYVPAFTDTTTSLNNQLNNVNDGLNNLTDDVNTVAKSADGKNSNYYGPDEPFNPASGDLWYKKNGDKTELWQYDGKSVPPGWKLLVDDSTGEEVKQRVKEVGEETQQAINDANDAVSNANNAVEQAGFAHDTAEAAKTNAVNALEQATAAFEHADGINESLTAEIDEVNNSLNLKANKTDVNRINGTINELQADIKLQADEISSKVSQNDVKGMLSGYATQSWTQSQVKQTADSINLSVNNVENKIDSLQAGGRNYLLDSDRSFEKAPNSSLNFTAATGFLDVAKGKQIVISFDIDVKDAIVKSGYRNRAGVSCTFIKEDNTRFYAEAWYTPKAYGDSFKGRVYNVVTVPANVVDGATTAGLFNQINADQMRLSRPKISIGNTKDDWTPAPEDYASVKKLSELQVTVDGIQGTVQNKADKSQITQLKNDINLRVTKNGVINQINISPESILIAGKKVHITGQTSIDNAVIKDAMIANIKADKITTGTLNAAKVNLINLNAKTITTGTLRGANLSMNLNTGQVVFQKGRIHSVSNNIDINLDETYISTADSSNRVILKGGELQFVQPQLFDTLEKPYLRISNSGGSASWSGATFTGRDYAVINTQDHGSSIFDTPIGSEEFAGFSMGKSHAGQWQPTKVAGADRGVVISGGLVTTFNGFGADSSPWIRVGGNKDGNKKGNRIRLWGEYVHIPSAYDQTTSTGANLHVAPDGALVRSTSASKYKTDIRRISDDHYGQKLLSLSTATWLDKADMQRYNNDPTNQPVPTRNFGMIAEDLAAADLEELVVRGSDGELEGINYDRIGPALIPVIAQLKSKIEVLENKLELI